MDPGGAWIRSQHGGLRIHVESETVIVALRDRRHHGHDLTGRCTFAGPANVLSNRPFPLLWRERFADWGIHLQAAGLWDAGDWPHEDPRLMLSHLVNTCEVSDATGQALGKVEFVRLLGPKQ